MRLFSAVLLICLLTSCQSGYYRDTNGYLRKVPDSLMYDGGWAPQASAAQKSYGVRQSTPQVVYYRLPSVPAAIPKKTSAKKVAAASTRVKSRSHTQSSSGLVLPPVPRLGYSARWDTRSVKGSPDGLFWVVNSAKQFSGLPPTKFWPFWSRCIRERVTIKVYEKYDPGNRFPDQFVSR